MVTRPKPPPKSLQGLPSCRTPMTTTASSISLLPSPHHADIMSTPNKAVLYHFSPGSVWAAVPVLTALEKGLGKEWLEQRRVDLGAGMNFSPAFLKSKLTLFLFRTVYMYACTDVTSSPFSSFSTRQVQELSAQLNSSPRTRVVQPHTPSNHPSPTGTVPVLVAPFEHTLTTSTGSSPDSVRYKALTSTIEICQFLDSSTLSVVGPSLSPATVQGSGDSKDIINYLHCVGEDGAPDPNALLLSFCSEEERKFKIGGMAGGFLRGRQEALEKYRLEEEALGEEKDERLLAFYERKIKVSSRSRSRVLAFAFPSEWIERHGKEGTVKIYEGLT